MLPGFRFLFAATLLTISLIVFGLGAAALLRASHDQFASLPARPVVGSQLATIAEPTTPTLSMLRIETPEPAESRPSPEPSVARLSADTLEPGDKVATFVAASRVETAPPAPPSVTVPPVLPEPKIERDPELNIEFKPEPPTIEAKAEPAPEPATQPIAPKVSLSETASATPAPISAPADPIVAKIEEAAKADPSPPIRQQVAALAEPDITSAISASSIVEPSLVNAKPIQKPPVPKDRPTDADVVAALPEPALASPAPQAATPAFRRRKPAVRRTVRKRPVIARPAAPKPSRSFFGT